MAVVLVPREVELEVTILFSLLNSPFVTYLNMYTLWNKLEISGCDIVRSIDVFILWKIYTNFYYDISNRSVIFRLSAVGIYKIPSMSKLLLSNLDRKYRLCTTNESSSRFERFDKRKKKWCSYNRSSLVLQSNDRSSISDKSIHSLAVRLIVHKPQFRSNKQNTDKWKFIVHRECWDHTNLKIKDANYDLLQLIRAMCILHMFHKITEKSRSFIIYKYPFPSTFNIHLIPLNFQILLLYYFNNFEAKFY